MWEVSTPPPATPTHLSSNEKEVKHVAHKQEANGAQFYKTYEMEGRGGVGVGSESRDGHMTVM